MVTHIVLSIYQIITAVFGTIGVKKKNVTHITVLLILSIIILIYAIVLLVLGLQKNKTWLDLTILILNVPFDIWMAWQVYQLKLILQGKLKISMLNNYNIEYQSLKE